MEFDWSLVLERNIWLVLKQEIDSLRCVNSFPGPFGSFQIILFGQNVLRQQKWYKKIIFVIFLFELILLAFMKGIFGKAKKAQQTLFRFYFFINIERSDFDKRNLDWEE